MCKPKQTSILTHFPPPLPTLTPASYPIFVPRSQITTEQAAQDEIDEKERQRMADIEAEKLRLANEAKKKAGKPGKAKKSASPTGKKVGKGVTNETAETTPVR